MGDQRSGDRRGDDSLPAVRLIEYRVSANDAKIHDAGISGAALRAENHSQGILLPGLPLHLEQRGRTNDRPALAPFFPGRRKSDLDVGGSSSPLSASRTDSSRCELDVNLAGEAAFI